MTADNPSDRAIGAQASKGEAVPGLTHGPKGTLAGASVDSRDAESSMIAVAAPVPASTEVHAKFAEETHQYIREYIRLADQKATFFFASATALLAFLYKNGLTNRWVKAPTAWSLVDTAAFLCTTALSASALLSMLVVIPRTPGSKRGFIFWEAVAEFESGRRFAEELGALSPSTLFQLKAEHAYALANVCRRKYSQLRAALWIGLAGLAGAVAIFLLA